MSKQIIVIGGGLAGYFSAAELAKSGHQVMLVDAEEPAASDVAAGMWNVIVGKYAIKSWKAEEQVTLFRQFFASETFAPLRKYVHPMEIYRPFKSQFEQNEWAAKSQLDEFGSWVDFQALPFQSLKYENPLGGIKIKQCGWVKIPQLLQGLREILTQKFGLKIIAGKYVSDQHDLQKQTLTVSGRKFSYDKMVFAEGIGARENTLWNWVKILPLKGQLMEVEIEEAESSFILSRKCFVIPKAGNRFIVGATYERRFEVRGPTKEGEKYLSDLLRRAVKLPFRILQMKAGIRPTTPNRRPVVGQHPLYPNLYIVNGMGTRGLLNAPWAAQQLNRMLSESVTEIQEEASVHRFKFKFS